MYGSADAAVGAALVAKAADTDEGTDAGISALEAAAGSIEEESDAETAVVTAIGDGPG
jgi:hypothetical protein